MEYLMMARISFLAVATCLSVPGAFAQQTSASFDGKYAGKATAGVAGPGGEAPTNPVCVNERPVDMVVHGGHATLWYHNWKSRVLHYRGQVDPSGKLLLSHLNGDGSRSTFTLQMSQNGATGEMARGRCSYTVAMSRS